MVKHFINLTNGIEWISEFPEYSFVRVESTAIEKQDWTRILRDLDANLLMNLALGNECHFYDAGTNREISKTVSIGVPFIKRKLTDFWIDNRCWRADTELEIQAKRKVGYYKRYLNTDEVKLIGHSKSTVNDSNKLYFKRKIHGS